MTSLGGTESQLQGHLFIGLHVGITESKLEQMLSIVETASAKKKQMRQGSIIESDRRQAALIPINQETIGGKSVC